MTTNGPSQLQTEKKWSCDSTWMTWTKYSSSSNAFFSISLSITFSNNLEYSQFIHKTSLFYYQTKKDLKTKYVIKWWKSIFFVVVSLHFTKQNLSLFSSILTFVLWFFSSKSQSIYHNNIQFWYPIKNSNFIVIRC